MSLSYYLEIPERNTLDGPHKNHYTLYQMPSLEAALFWKTRAAIILWDWDYNSDHKNIHIYDPNDYNYIVNGIISSSLEFVVVSETSLKIRLKNQFKFTYNLMLDILANTSSAGIHP